MNSIERRDGVAVGIASELNLSLVNNIAYQSEILKKLYFWMVVLHQRYYFAFHIICLFRLYNQSVEIQTKISKTGRFVTLDLKMKCWIPLTNFE